MSDEPVVSTSPSEPEKPKKKKRLGTYSINPEMLAALKASTQKTAILTPGGLIKEGSSPPPPKPFVPITRDTWESMNGKAQWDSIVALRGPDLVNSETLKFYTSSVVRYRMSKVMRVGGLVNSYLPFVVLPTGGVYDTPDSGFSASHFTGHIYEAALWLKIPIAQVPNNIWDLMLDGSTSRNKMGQLILPYLAPDQKQAMKSFLSANGVYIPKEPSNAKG